MRSIKFSIPNSHDSVVANTIDPDDAVRLHFVGDVAQPLLVFAEHLSEAIDRGDMMDLVDVHGPTQLGRRSAEVETWLRAVTLFYKPSPSTRPSLHSMPPPSRITPVISRPRCSSMTGRQGTSWNSKAFSTIANLPDASCRVPVNLP